MYVHVVESSLQRSLEPLFSLYLTPPSDQLVGKPSSFLSVMSSRILAESRSKMEISTKYKVNDKSIQSKPKNNLAAAKLQLSRERKVHQSPGSLSIPFYLISSGIQPCLHICK